MFSKFQKIESKLARGREREGERERERREGVREETDNCLPATVHAHRLQEYTLSTQFSRTKNTSDRVNKLNSRQYAYVSRSYGLPQHG